MKLKLIFFALVASISSSQAVIVTATTDFMKGVTDNSGAGIAAGSGFVGVGFLNNDVDFTSFRDSSILASSFTQFGESATFGTGASNVDGFFEFNASGGRVSSESEFFGQQVVMILGNGADISSSNEIAVVSFDNMFPDDSEAAIDQQFRVSTNEPGSVLFGNQDGPTFTAAGSDFESIQLGVVIPEPSVSLLGGLALFGGLLRRRR